MRISDWSSDVCSSDLAARAYLGIRENNDLIEAARFHQMTHRCALLVSGQRIGDPRYRVGRGIARGHFAFDGVCQEATAISEVRRGGRGCVSPWRYRGSPCYEKKK